MSHKNFTYFSFYGRGLIVVFLVSYVHVHHRSRSKEIKLELNWSSHQFRLQGRRKLFLIGGLKARAEGPRKFLNLESLKCDFLDPAAPPPVATYGPGLHAEMHRMASKDYHSKVLLDIFFRPFILARYFF